MILFFKEFQRRIVPNSASFVFFLRLVSTVITLREMWIPNRWREWERQRAKITGPRVVPFRRRSSSFSSSLRIPERT